MFNIAKTMRILEVFDTRLDYSIDTKNNSGHPHHWIARFTTDKDQYMFMTEKHSSLEYLQVISNYVDKYYSSIIPDKTDVWSIGFMSESSGYDATNHGEAQAVLRTVFDITTEWVREVNPEIIMFSAKGEEESRVRLYDSLAKKVEQSYGMYVYIGNSRATPKLGFNSDTEYFWMVRKDLIGI